MKSVTLLMVLLAAWLSSAAAYASVKASVDTDQAASGDLIELTLTHDGKTGSKPDLAPLEQDFEVVSTSQSSNVQIINGSYSSETQLIVTLAPKRSGQFTIPSLTWDNEKTSPLRISVGGNGDARSGTAQAQSSMFLKTTLDDSRPYVQGAVNLTVRLYAAVHMYRATLGMPASSDVFVQQLGEDSSSETEVNGQHYDVIERHYLLLPQHSGVIKMPGPTLDADVPFRIRENRFGQSFLAEMMQTSKPVRIHADEIVLDVRPRPAAATARYWIPAKNLDVTSEWHPDNFEVHAGEPVTLDVRLRAIAMTAAQLPEIASLLQLPTGLKAYPDQPKLDNSVRNGSIVGSREQSIALIADQPGSFSLPAIHIQWWDTVADQLREAELPARTLKVLPALGAAPGVPAPRNEIVSNALPRSAGAHSVPPRIAAPGVWPWHWVSLALAVLWIGTLLAWWWSRRRAFATPVAARAAPAVKPNESQARARFVAACKLNDAITARRALLEWARAKWPQSPPAGLRALSNRLSESKLDALLMELDRACFAGAEWHGSALALALDRLRGTEEKTNTGRTELAELYP